MLVTLISDTHGFHENLKMESGEIIIFSGDMSSRGYKKEVNDFLQWFSKLNYTHKICIAGNHDFYFDKLHYTNPNKLPYNILDIIPENVIYLKNSSVKINGLNIYGIPQTPYFHNWSFNCTEEELEKICEDIPLNTDILITHGPPYSILDYTNSGHNAGCKSLLERVKVVQPKLHVFGHIHENRGLHKSGKTQFVNASSIYSDYSDVYNPISINI